MQLDWSGWGLFTGSMLLVSVFFLQWFLKQKKQSPSLYFSNLDLVDEIEVSWKVRYAPIVDWLKKVAFICLALSLAHLVLKLPRNTPEKKPPKPEKESHHESTDQVHLPTEGIALYFILDQSGSMQAEMGALKGYKGPKKILTRLEVLKHLTSEFIKGSKEFNLQGRSEDLIGLVSFARVPKIMVPLTLDHELVQEQLKELRPARSITEDGTAIGYAIYKTAHLIAATEYFSKNFSEKERPAYEIKNTAMILVTDGIQNPNHLDVDHSLRSMGVKKAAEFAQEKGIHLYIINIEPALAYAQYQQELNELKQAAECTGGQFFLVNNIQQLQKIYRVIDQIEKVKQKDPQSHQIRVEEKLLKAKDPMHYQKIPLYAYLLQVGLIALFLGFLGESTVFRRAP